METLTQRQHFVLNLVVETHIETAAPVGSQGLRERYALDSSPATLRNEMSTLEDRGYLMHPHTSSGRIPTDQGYRYYVDHCLQAQLSPQGIINRVQDHLLDLSREAPEPESFVEEASRTLSFFIQEASLAFFAPSQDTPDLRKGTRVFVQGSSHILEKPEFQDMQKVRTLFRVLEDKEGLAGWIRSEAEGQDILIRIGHENPIGAFQECAVLAARYRASDDASGMLALVGPTRMRYTHAVPLLKSVAALVGEILNERF